MVGEPDSVAHVAREIEQVSLDGRSTLRRAFELLSERWRARVFSYRAFPEEQGFAVEHVESSGWIEAETLRAELEGFVRNAREPFPAYDPLRPATEQRNRVRTFRTELFEGHELGAFNRRVGISDGEQMRVLVCDGPVLLAWVGGVRHEPFEAREREELASLIPPLQRRLTFERRLSMPMFSAALLASTLEQITVPAFVVTRGHLRIELANQLGVCLLERSRREVLDGIRDALCGRSGVFRMVSLAANGMSEHALVVHNGAPELLVTHAAREWGLTDRQREVLAQVVEGQPNKVIAERLACSVRNVEAHLGAIMKKAGVDQRTSLAARVLGLSRGSGGLS